MIQSIIYDIDERKKDELKSCLPEVLNRYFGIAPRTDKRKYMVCCPFHQEKTPSFEIDTVKGLYHCFGCGKCGDVFTLVAEEESLNLEDWKDFQQTAKIIADIGGVWFSEKNTEKRTDKKIYQPNPCNLPNHSIIRPSVKVISQPLYYISEELLQKSSSRVKETGLYNWLIKEFNQTKVDEVLALYKVGASSYKTPDGFLATTFPMINSKGQCVDCKIFHIDPKTGSRKSSPPLYSWNNGKTGKLITISTTFAISDMNRKTCMACSDKLNCKDKETCSKLKRRKIDTATGKTEWPYFGEHFLMNLDRNKPVAIVESEKTAIVCSIVYPKFVWLATGSKANLSPERFFPLRNFDCTIFPDRDGLTGNGNWKDKASQLSKSGYRIKLDTTLTKYPGETHDDLADIIIRLKNGTESKTPSTEKISATNSIPTENKNSFEEDAFDEEDPFKQSPHEIYGEFIPWRLLIPEPKVKYSKEWNKWLFDRVTWYYDQREDFCRHCVHAVFYTEKDFRCREKITMEEAASQKICRGFQQK